MNCTHTSDPSVDDVKLNAILHHQDPSDYSANPDSVFSSSSSYFGNVSPTSGIDAKPTIPCDADPHHTYRAIIDDEPYHSLAAAGQAPLLARVRHALGPVEDYIGGFKAPVVQAATAVSDGVAHAAGPFIGASSVVADHARRAAKRVGIHLGHIAHVTSISSKVGQRIGQYAAEALLHESGGHANNTPCLACAAEAHLRAVTAWSKGKAVMTRTAEDDVDEARTIRSAINALKKSYGERKTDQERVAVYRAILEYVSDAKRVYNHMYRNKRDKNSADAKRFKTFIDEAIPKVSREVALLSTIDPEPAGAATSAAAAASEVPITPPNSTSDTDDESESGDTVTDEQDAELRRRLNALGHDQLPVDGAQPVKPTGAPAADAGAHYTKLEKSRSVHEVDQVINKRAVFSHNGTIYVPREDVVSYKPHDFDTQQPYSRGQLIMPRAKPYTVGSATGETTVLIYPAVYEAVLRHLLANGIPDSSLDRIRAYRQVQALLQAHYIIPSSVLATHIANSLRCIMWHQGPGLEPTSPRCLALLAAASLDGVLGAAATAGCAATAQSRQQREDIIAVGALATLAGIVVRGSVSSTARQAISGAFSGARQAGSGLASSASAARDALHAWATRRVVRMDTEHVRDETTLARQCSGSQASLAVAPDVALVRADATPCVAVGPVRPAHGMLAPVRDQAALIDAVARRTGVETERPCKPFISALRTMVRKLSWPRYTPHPDRDAMWRAHLKATTRRRLDEHEKSPSGRIDDHAGFLKGELMCTTDGPADAADDAPTPRVIVSAHEDYLLAIGPTLWDFTQTLKEYWIDCGITLGSGMTQSELGVAIDEAWDGHMVVETDFSKYDATLSTELLNIELEVYTACGVPSDVVNTIRQQLDSRVQLGDGAYVDMSGGRRSGDANTSLGNSIIQVLCFTLMLHSLHEVRFDDVSWQITRDNPIFAMGDDSLVFIRGDERPDVQGFMRGFGLKAKCKWHDEPIGATFLGGLIAPVHTPSGSQLSLLPRPSGIAKWCCYYDGAACSDAAVLETAHADNLMRLRVYRAVPIAREYAKLYHAWLQHNGVHARWRVQDAPYQAVLADVEPPNADDATFSAVADYYGITTQDIKRCEDYLRSIDPCTTEPIVVDHPILTRIFKVDEKWADWDDDEETKGDSGVCPRLPTWRAYNHGSSANADDGPCGYIAIALARGLGDRTMPERALAMAGRFFAQTRGVDTTGPATLFDILTCCNDLGPVIFLDGDAAYGDRLGRVSGHTFRYVPNHVDYVGVQTHDVTSPPFDALVMKKGANSRAPRKPKQRRTAKPKPRGRTKQPRMARRERPVAVAPVALGYRRGALRNDNRRSWTGHFEELCLNVMDTHVSGAPAVVSIDPINATTFPWLSSMAALYERYQFHELYIVFESVLPATNGGAICCAVDFDMDSTDTSMTYSAMRRMETFHSDILWAAHTWRLTRSGPGNRGSIEQVRYLNPSGIAGDTPTVDKILGNLIVMRDGGTSVPVGVIGRIILRGRISFFDPVLAPVSAGPSFEIEGSTLKILSRTATNEDWSGSFGGLPSFFPPGSATTAGLGILASMLPIPPRSPFHHLAPASMFTTGTAGTVALPGPSLLKKITRFNADGDLLGALTLPTWLTITEIPGTPTTTNQHFQVYDASGTAAPSLTPLSYEFKNSGAIHRKVYANFTTTSTTSSDAAYSFFQVGSIAAAQAPVGNSIVTVADTGGATAEYLSTVDGGTVTKHYMTNTGVVENAYELWVDLPPNSSIQLGCVANRCIMAGTVNASTQTNITSISGKPSAGAAANLATFAGSMVMSNDSGVASLVNALRPAYQHLGGYITTGIPNPGYYSAGLSDYANVLWTTPGFSRGNLADDPHPEAKPAEPFPSWPYGPDDTLARITARLAELEARLSKRVLVVEEDDPSSTTSAAAAAAGPVVARR